MIISEGLVQQNLPAQFRESLQSQPEEYGML